MNKFINISMLTSSWLKWLIITAACVIEITHTAKILGIFPHASESHFVVMRTFMMELTKREHNVTLYSSHRLDDHIENLHENVIEPEFPFWNEIQKEAGVNDLQSLSAVNSDNLSKYLAKAGYSLMNYFLSNQKMQNLLKLSHEDFDYDLIVVDIFFTEALLVLGYHFSVPVIGIVNTDFANYMNQIQDLMVPAACLPYDLSSHSTDLNFWQRSNNIKSCLDSRQSFINNHYGQQEKIIQTHFKQFKESTPSIMELQANLGLLLVNNYYPLATPRATIPNIIPVGGLHIRAPKELPWHMRRYLDEARFGAIYMHLGDEKNCADIPKDKLNVLLQTLGERQEHVIWTCHDIQKMDDLPKNIMIQHLVPQTDILAHPHIKLFIMNGDIMGLQESIIRHVPLLGIPLFANEFKNILLAEKLQIGVRVNYNNLTEISLRSALETILHKEFYVLNIRDVSKVYRDRPLGGLASSIFWLDYIERYGSGPLKIQSPSISLNNLHLSDLRLRNYIVLFLVICISVSLYFLGIFLWRKRQTAKLFSKLN